MAPNAGANWSLGIQGATGDRLARLTEKAHNFIQSIFIPVLIYGYAMRISQEEAIFLKKEISVVLPDALIYLFGASVDDGKKGGDIDIMILSRQN